MKFLFQKAKRHLRFLFEYYVTHQADPISYLRARGTRIGENCDLLGGVNSFGTEPYLIRLGDNVTLTGGVLLLTHDGATRVFRSSESRWCSGMGVYGRIDIGDNVFIGSNSVVLPGVTIGANTVIGAGSVVTWDVPSGTVVAGNPAREICSIDNYCKRAVKKAIIISELGNKRAELETYFWNE